jgi:hypothetical protein
MNGRPTTNSPSRAMTIVAPAKSTARRGEGRDSRIPGRLRLGQCLAVAGDDEERVVDADADHDHDVRPEGRHDDEVAERREDPVANPHPEQGGEDRQAHGHHRPEGEEHDYDGRHLQARTGEAARGVDHPLNALAGRSARARLRRNADRGHQRPVGCPARDGVPAVLVKDRDPQGSARRLNSRGRRGRRAGGPAPRPRAFVGPRPQEPAVGPGPQHPRHHVEGRASAPDPRERGRLRPRCRCTARRAAASEATRPRADRTFPRPRRRPAAELGERDADDIIHAVTSPEVYRPFVCDRAWPPERYEQWLKEILINQLLPPPATEPGEG